MVDRVRLDQDSGFSDGNTTVDAVKERQVNWVIGRSKGVQTVLASAVQYNVKRHLQGALVAGLMVFAGFANAALPIERWTTPQGAKVMFMQAPAIPMVDIQVDLDAGARRDPAQLTGLASMTAALLDKGAEGLKENEIEDALADVGAQLGGGASADRLSVSLRSLTSRAELDRAVDVLVKVLQKPEFPADILERERARRIAAIREAKTKPDAIAHETFMALMYGDHPYGRTASEASVQRISADDLKRFHAANFAAGRAVVSIVGNLTREQAADLAQRLVAGLPTGQAAEPIAAPNPPIALEKRIAHPSSQSHVLMGLPAMRRGDPDFFPLVVGNYILGGGGFVSRLMTEVREKRGLAYSAYAYFSPMSQPGPFEMGLQTQREQTDTALKVARDTLFDFLAKGPTEAELKAAKSNLVGGFPLRLDSNRKLLDQISVIGYFNLPNDYLDTWTRNIEAVTVSQVRDAFARRVKPENLITVVVGQGEVPLAR